MGSWLTNFKKIKLLCYGEAMIELQQKTSDLSEGFDLAFGGDALTTAAMAKRLGLQVKYLSAFGKDEWQKFLEAELKELRLFEGVQFLDGMQSGLYFIYTDQQGERRFQYYRKGSAASHWEISEREISEAKNSDCVFSSGIAQAISEQSKENQRKLFESAKLAGGFCAFDINYRSRLWSLETATAALREVLANIDFLFMSEEDLKLAQELLGSTQYKNLSELALDLCAQGPKVVILRRGRSSIILAEAAGRQVNEIEAEKVEKPLDTTGAGDVFNASWVAEYLTNKSALRATQLASKLAALQIQKKGSIRALPSVDEISKINKSL